MLKRGAHAPDRLVADVVNAEAAFRNNLGDLVNADLT